MTMHLRRLTALAGFAAFGIALAAESAPAPTATAPAAPIPPKPQDRVGPITLVDESPGQVVALLEKVSGRIAIRSGELPPAKINFTSGRDLSRAEAEAALESVLALNGVAVIRDGSVFFKAVPALKGREPATEAPTLHLDSIADLPPGERVVSRLITLNHVPYSAVDAAVQALVNKTRGASAIPIPSANSVLVTDSVANVRRIEILVERADSASKVIFFPLAHARASEVVKQLTALRTGGLKNSFVGDVGFESSEVGNRVIVVTPDANEASIREIIKGLDTEDTPVTRSELIPLRHAEASDVVELVRNIATGNSGVVGSAALRNLSGAAATGATRRGATPTNTSRTVSSNGQVYISQNYNIDPSKKPAGDDAAFSPYFTVVADSRGNSLVIYGTDRDIRQVRDLIAKVDVRLAQVRIEAVIVEVTLGTAQASGLETLGFGLYTGTQGVANGRKNGDLNFNGAATGLPSDSGAGKPPIAISGSLKDFSLQAVFNKARDDSRIKLLSSPVIVTSHNAPALIKVGQRQPIITGTTTSTVTAGTTSSQVEYRDIGLEVNITPRIGANGVVEMQISQKNESIIGNTTIDGNQQPIIGNREAQSYVTAANNETIVLAGLQSFAETKSKGKVWLLGDIPLLGPWLFQPESTLSKKTELIIFLKPHVITEDDTAPSRDSPGFRDGSLTKESATERIHRGVFKEVTDKTTVFEREKSADKTDDNTANGPKPDTLPGMHD